MALESSSIRMMEYLYLFYMNLPFKQKIDLARHMEEISGHDPR